MVFAVNYQFSYPSSLASHESGANKTGGVFRDGSWEQIKKVTRAWTTAEKYSADVPHGVGLVRWVWLLGWF